MKKIGLTVFRWQLRQLLKELPLEITDYGDTIAFVISPQSKDKIEERLKQLSEPSAPVVSDPVPVEVEDVQSVREPGPGEFTRTCQGCKKRGPDVLERIVPHLEGDVAKSLCSSCWVRAKRELHL